MIMKHILLAGSCLALTACQAVAAPAQIAQMAPSEAAAIDQRAAQIIAKMTLEEKIGQIIQADIASVTPQEVKQYNLGSVLNGGNSAPGGGKTATPEQWVALADEFWLASTDRSDGGVGIPLLWGTDAVHGHNNLQNATIFPHNIGLGAANDPALIERIAAVTAAEIRATGLDWTFAPTLAVAQDDRWGRTYESYSERPEIVAAYSAAMVRGLQGDPAAKDFLKGEKVISTAKHFIGDGGTTLGIDKGDTQGEIDAILTLHGAGYGPAIAADVQTVMASFSSVNGTKMHGDKYLLTDILREKMGFEGFVIGDWNGHGEVPGCTATDCPAALDAGIDMYMAPDSWRGLYDNLLMRANNGSLNLARLDEAVARILRVKIRSGLLDSTRPSARPTSRADVLGAPAHRAVAREAVRKSLVLLKNNDQTLPLKPGQHVLVTGSGADSIEQQSGGWTLNWQGTGNANDEFAAAETIYDGLQSAMADIGGTATLSADGQFSKRPDVAVVVFGEMPYAEYRGDRTDLVFERDDAANISLLRSLQQQKIPTVAIFLSGRPMWVNPHINSSDAFVAAWLPGTEGGGIADVLVGDKAGKARYDFSGRLSFSWPSRGDGKPINQADEPGILFPFGYGMTYVNAKNFAPLSEDPGIDLARVFKGTIIERGDAAAGFASYVGDSSNANVPAQALVSRSLGGALQTRGIDYKAQEDAREISWSADGPGTYTIRSNRTLNLDQLGYKDTANLVIEWKINQPPSSPIEIFMGCGEGCEGKLTANKLLGQFAGDRWATATIPLACFKKVGFNPANMDIAFGLKANGPAVIAIHSIKLNSESKQAADCSAFE